MLIRKNGNIRVFIFSDIVITEEDDSMLLWSTKNMQKWNADKNSHNIFLNKNITILLFFSKSER